MIKVNGREVKVNHFPDGSQALLNVDITPSIPRDGARHFDICWLSYNGDEECMTLFYITKHIREHYPNATIALSMPYIINARMDRVKSYDEVFTLKWFCQFINSLNFKVVRVLDAHSNVSLALLDRVEVINVERHIGYVIGYVLGENDYVYFPDAGSMKRYATMECFSHNNLHIIYGEKDRDWKTGEIQGLKIFDRDGERIDTDENYFPKRASVLMVDDIISYGGTLYHSAKKLKKMGAGDIYAYATHTENSVLDKEKGTFIKCLEDGTVNRLYTTDSLYAGSHPRITVI